MGTTTRSESGSGAACRRPGYVLDFGLVKKLTKEIVDRLDERTLIPARSDCLRIEPLGEQMRIRYEADEFILPRKDLCLLPIVHTSAEELARFIWDELRGALEKNRALGGVNVAGDSGGRGSRTGRHLRVFSVKNRRLCRPLSGVMSVLTLPACA